MEAYNAPGQEYPTDTYLIQGSKLSGQYASQNPDHLGTMYSEGVPEFVIDHGMYCPAPTSYGYVCTGVESPGDWDDHQMVFGLDGLDVHYAGAELENSPFVYYTPSFAYPQSPYNPYNPYIPGAVVGIDGSFLGSQQYYNHPSYDNHSSSPMYFPMLVQPRSDINAHNTSHSFVDTTSSTAYRADGPSLKHNLSSTSPAFSATSWLPVANQTNSARRASEGNNAVAGSSKRSMAKGTATPSGLFHQASSPVIHSKSVQEVEFFPPGKALASGTQSKMGLSGRNGFSSFSPSIHAQSTADKKFPCEKVLNETKTCADKSRQQNQAPKFDIPRNNLTGRAFTSRAGDADTQGNITLHRDQYDRNDFLIDYPNAKFFIIKSYSEDDVHKSIKYNVWSSTPNGNKKLNSAYEDAQRICRATSGSCPVFLFFSVNASGQFCGVAEMTGPVDFRKDMDFWQQDKWSGSFPVKWHLVKDVPNPNFRHIILENNDNKPVTNSRDTQELLYKKGMEMLKIFSSCLSKTSLRDDFPYYDNRQRLLQEEKIRLLKNYNKPFFAPVLDPPLRKQNPVSDKENKIASHKDSTSSSSDKSIVAADFTDAAKCEAVVPNGQVNVEEALKLSSPNIASTQSGSDPLEAATGTVSGSTSNDVLTIGSIPVKVNGSAEPSGFLTVGTIPLDPRALQDLVDGSVIRGTVEG